MHKVIIENMSFYGFHGLYDEENKIGGKYTIDIELNVDFNEAIKTDEITTTINYAEVIEIVQEEMNKPSKLIEHVGGRIVKKLKIKFEKLQKVKLKISKCNPPIKAKLDKVSIVIEE